jgi:hypothetical protein
MLGSAAEAEVRGARAVAGTFVGRARFARPALVEGAVGAVWAPGGRPRVVFAFTVSDGRVADIRLLADPSAWPSWTWSRSTRTPVGFRRR